MTTALLPPPAWNQTEVDYPEALLPEIFEAQAARTPDLPAISDDRETLSYAELNVRVNRLAHYLVELGAGPETLVAVCLTPSVDLLVALYAVLKSGAAYVPIDPDYPAERIEFMLRDADAPILLTERGLIDRLAAGSARVVVLDAEADRLARQPETNPPGRATPANLAYVIFTSGSTGNPKGAMIEHRAIANNIRFMQSTYGLGPGDRVLQKVPFSFDLAQWELFWPLLFGAQLIVVPPGLQRDGTYLVETMIARGITMVHAVPSMLQLLLEHPRIGEWTTLRHALCDGEALPRALQDRFYSRVGGELHNLYGPTEAAVAVTAWACDPASDLTFVPIGKPIANTRIHLLDDRMAPVPVGSDGELYIGGVQVGRGYLNRPELTAERFVDDPFAAMPGARLYRTGDLARYLPDGNIEFLGRADFQVKIRGFRVELGEIEAAMEAFPGIEQAVVVAHRRADGEQELVGYLAGSAAASVAIDELRARLAARLPEYMVPTAYVRVPRFQLTPNGKIDRAALPEPVRDRADLGVAYVAPRTELERLIVERWGELLGIERIGIHDRFFELGGTSLQAARFVQAIAGTLDASIFVVTLFTAPSPAEYATLLEAQYPDAVARVTGGPVARTGAARPRARITGADVDRLRAAVPTVPFVSGSSGEPNPPAIFILAPPRSGTTLLRVMLAGHAELFAASELQLLGFDTLRQRAAAYTGRFSVWLDGTVRAIMEAEGLDADAAKASIAAGEAADLTTKQLYRRLQDAVAPRILVDKSPSYALDLEALRRAEAWFDGARYVHLIRDPAATIDSFVRRHVDQVLYLDDHPFEPAQLAELVWTASHSTITDFLATVPSERWVRLRYEDLVVDPARELRAVCAGLGVAFDPAILRPYEGLERKMVDGVYAESTPMGDPGFVSHGRIDPALAAVNPSRDARHLGEPTLELAELLGYGPRVEEPAEGAGNRRSASRLRALRLGARGRG